MEGRWEKMGRESRDTVGSSMNVPHPAMTDEEYQKFAVFKKDGNRHLESGGSTDQSPWTDEFAKMIQLFRILTEDIDFSRAFRIVIDYDPEQPRTIVKHLR